MAGDGTCTDSDTAGQLLDGTLRELNTDYDIFRNQRRIGTPEVLLVPATTIYEWSKTVRGKLGGQSKIPHIDPTSDSSLITSLREFVDRH